MIKQQYLLCSLFFIISCASSGGAYANKNFELGNTKEEIDNCLSKAPKWSYKAGNNKANGTALGSTLASARKSAQSRARAELAEEVQENVKEIVRQVFVDNLQGSAEEITQGIERRVNLTIQGMKTIEYYHCGTTDGRYRAFALVHLDIDKFTNSISEELGNHKESHNQKDFENFLDVVEDKLNSSTLAIGKEKDTPFNLYSPNK